MRVHQYASEQLFLSSPAQRRLSDDYFYANILHRKCRTFGIMATLSRVAGFGLLIGDHKSMCSAVAGFVRLGVQRFTNNSD
jgi:hypothetical protein